MPLSNPAAAGAHPDLATHDALGLATQAELDSAGVSDPLVIGAVEATDHVSVDGVDLQPIALVNPVTFDGVEIVLDLVTSTIRFSMTALPGAKVKFRQDYINGNKEADFIVGAEDPSASPAANENWNLFAFTEPTTGTFTITNDNLETTDPIPWNASAQDVQDALEALFQPGMGNIEVTGGPLPADLNFEFVGAKAEQLIRPYTIDSSGLDGEYQFHEEQYGKEAGIDATTGSLYARNGTTGEMWLKTGSGNTDWQRLLTTDDLP